MRDVREKSFDRSENPYAIMQKEEKETFELFISALSRMIEKYGKLILDDLKLVA